MSEKENINPESDKENIYCQKTLQLQECFRSIAEDILKNVTDEQFIEIYKKCYKEFEPKENIEQLALSGSSKEARKYRNQFNAMVMSTFVETINDTVLSMNSKIRELEELKKVQSDSTTFWRPPGNAHEHIIPFDYMCELEKKKELEKRIIKEKETLHLLKARLVQKRNTVKELHEEILTSMKNIEHLITCNTSQ